MPDVLIELFSEEIPARMQVKAADDLKRLITDGLVEAGLTYAGAAAFSTPRRLTLSIDGLTAESAAVREERKGPNVNAPDKAIEGFLRGVGLTRDQVEERDDKKGKVLFAVIEKPGRPAAEIIADVLEKTVRNFPWPKSMRWGTGSLRWVRPLQSMICLLIDEAGAEVVPLDIDGITTGNTTRGHRFMAPDAFSVTSFDDYEAKLKRAKVVLRADERSDAIWQEATNQAFASGVEVVEDKGLLAEVAGLVEWPVVLMGDIADDYLSLPDEVLQTSMKDHQKFFSVRNPKTGRIERFITVANIETADNGATIIAGNAKVLAARLADAKFFWENDLRVAKAGMQPWLDGLANVTFHNKLGSQRDRIDRIAALAREIAPVVGADPDLAHEAALIAKADLQSEMVYEFPELQGLMGRYYAEAAGRDLSVAEAAEMHWKPLGPSDDVPTAPVSVAVALADKLDTLAGFWAINELPTGSKDPFALRRAALGEIRLLVDNAIRLSLSGLVAMTFKNLVLQASDSNRLYFVVDDKGVRKLAPGSWGGDTGTWEDFWLGPVAKDALLSGTETAQIDEKFVRIDQCNIISEHLLAFFHDRLKVYLRDKGIPHHVIDACIAMPGNDDLTLLVKRTEALAGFISTDDGENLIQGFKRANNILSQAEDKDGVEYSYGAELKFTEHEAEKLLFAALDDADAAIEPALAAEDFNAAMQAMAGLRAPIDAFFEAVQVNADSEVVRRNRLNLLSRIRKICLSVADLNRIEG